MSRKLRWSSVGHKHGRERPKHDRGQDEQKEYQGLGVKGLPTSGSQPRLHRRTILGAIKNPSAQTIYTLRPIKRESLVGLKHQYFLNLVG